MGNDTTLNITQYRRKSINRNMSLAGNAMFIFKENSSIRHFLKDFISHPYFDQFIYSVIGVSSIILALDEPNISQYTYDFIRNSNYIIFSIFVLEMILKQIVMGVWSPPESYLRDDWNKLDCFIVIISSIDIILTDFTTIEFNLTFLRVLRTLRALRPLRMLSRNEKMKKIITALFRAIPAVLNVLMISILFYLIFGILGVMLFKGTFFKCTDSEIDNEDECEGMFIDEGGEE